MDLVSAMFIIRILIEAFPKLAKAWNDFSQIKDPTPADWDRIVAMNRGLTYEELVHGTRPPGSSINADKGSVASVQLAEVKEESAALTVKADATAAAAKELDSKIK